MIELGPCKPEPWRLPAGTTHAAQEAASTASPKAGGLAVDFCPWERHTDGDGQPMFRNRITGAHSRVLGRYDHALPRFKSKMR